MDNMDVLPPDAESPELAARLSGMCRSRIYQAINPDPAKRGGLPFLPSLLIGGSRRIRRETRLKWLAELEAATVAAEAHHVSAAVVAPGARPSPAAAAA